MRNTKTYSLIDEKEVWLDNWISGLRCGCFFTDE